MHESGCACCTQGPEAALAEQLRMIRDHGFMYQAVFGGEDGPGFVYTIGLAQRGLPEFIFVGDCRGPCANYMRGVIEAAMSGVEVPLGMLAPESDLNPYSVPAWVLAADDKLDTHAFGVRRQLERVGSGETPRLLQVVMPDLSGRFPWEEGYKWLDQQVSAPPVTGRA